jgi:hypothetical protein
MHMASTFAHLTGLLYGARRPTPDRHLHRVGQGIAVMLGTA